MSRTDPALSAGDLELCGILDGRRAFVGPEQVVVDLTNGCNNNCIGCWTRSPLLNEAGPPDRWRGQELPYDRVIDLLNDLADLGTRRVRFTGGGEPLLHPRADDILRAAKQRGLLCCVTTNGTLLTPERAALCAELPLDELAVSLWAATPDTYARVHPNKTGRTFERIVEALTLLCRKKRLRPRVTLAQVLFAMNYREAEAMYELARRVGADAVYYTLLDPIAGRTDGLLLSPSAAQELDAALRRVEAGSGPERENWEGLRRRVRAIWERPPEGARGEYDAAVIDRLPCTVGWLFCRVLADGNVVPCCRGSDMPLGNIVSEGFRAVWLSERYAEFRHKAKTLSKRDPFFVPMGCHKTCDNLMHIEAAAERLRQLTPEESARLARYLADQER